MKIELHVYGNKKKKKFIILSIVVFAAMLFAFCFTAYTTGHRSTLQFDIDVFACLQSIRTGRMTRLMTAITFFGSRYFLFPCYTVLVIFFLFFRKKLWFAIAIALTGFLGNQVLFFLQGIFRRQRPENPLIDPINTYGYPSGHSFASFTFAGLLSYLILKYAFNTKFKIALIIICFVMATAIAISRVYLRVHYPTDVLGGFYLSILWLIPCLWILYFTDK